jgi:hypothetical protein
MFTIVYRPDFFLSTPIPCYIFIKQMSLFVVGGGGVSTYNFMLYVNVRRLNNSVLTYCMHKGNNKFTELRTILQRESQNS